MMFIEITMPGDNKVVINSRIIRTLYDKDGVVRLFVSDDDPTRYVEIKETYEEIKTLLHAK